MTDPKTDKYADIGKLNLEIEENKYLVNLFGNTERKCDVNTIISNLIQSQIKKI